jgi:hypothetical protein
VKQALSIAAAVFAETPFAGSDTQAMVAGSVRLDGSQLPVIFPAARLALHFSKHLVSALQPLASAFATPSSHFASLFDGVAGGPVIPLSSQ